MTQAIDPVVRVECLARRHDMTARGSRLIPEETPIAFTYGGSTHAVMMATPSDLEDFAVGFAVTEGLIDCAEEAGTVETIVSEMGIELRLWLAGARQEAYAMRRRTMAGPTGCGLCGIESLEAASREPRELTSRIAFHAEGLIEAMECLPLGQKLNQETRAVHGAGFWHPNYGLMAVREDVGRHNALDKLVGALVRQNIDASEGVILMTSRVSVELIQKTARIGAPVIAAVSAPTALAVRMAEKCHMTLIAVMRGREFEIFTYPERIIEQVSKHVA